LFSGDIYSLDLSADLVVLSACETGLGKISKGEGIIGLTRALIYAGSNNLVVSLWRVGDASTSLLMTDFYRSMLQGSSYAESLSNAKIGMINSKEYSSPYYWAPFVLIGQ
jgi:CHAT domain-containing protein